MDNKKLLDVVEKLTTTVEVLSKAVEELNKKLTTRQVVRDGKLVEISSLDKKLS